MKQVLCFLKFTKNGLNIERLVRRIYLQMEVSLPIPGFHPLLLVMGTWKIVIFYMILHTMPEKYCMTKYVYVIVQHIEYHSMYFSGFIVVVLIAT